jgi:hypothetical protein
MHYGITTSTPIFDRQISSRFKTFVMRNLLCMWKFRNAVVITCLIFQILCPQWTEAQSVTFEIKATGTGNTTGHVADISVKNSTGAPVKINPQTCYIPSGGQYQPYIAFIPAHTFPPGTTSIQLDGYCADIHKPAVPTGNPLPPVEQWIPVVIPGKISPQTGINILPKPELPPFLPKDIPNLIQTPGYTPQPADPESEIVITWPGTDIPVGGSIDPVNFPERFAPMLVEALDRITKTFDEMALRGNIHTPYHQEPDLQREAVIQQTFWIFTATITGEPYRKEQFHIKVIEQFEDNSSSSMETLPEKEKEKIETGVDEFWKTFTAVGTEAKLLSKK